VLRTEGVTPYAGSVALLDALRERGMPMAIVSSSRNAPAVLEAAGVTQYFATVMHGGLAVERGLPGKPAPDTFVAAAADLGVTPDRAVVLEDAVSGVQAGAAGEFALVIGVDRGVGPDALRLAGADVVVDDLADLA
jgi:HAD superfamily hydrolase (TIGR01509 family)